VSAWCRAPDVPQLSDWPRVRLRHRHDVVDSLACFVVWAMRGLAGVEVSPLLMVPRLRSSMRFWPPTCSIPRRLAAAGLALCITLIVLTVVAGSASLGKARQERGGARMAGCASWAKPRTGCPSRSISYRRSLFGADSLSSQPNTTACCRRHIILTIKTETAPLAAPRAPPPHIEIDKVAVRFIRVIAHYGFMETPERAEILEHCRRTDLNSTSPPRRSSCRGARSGHQEIESRAGRRLFSWLAGRAEDPPNTSASPATAVGGWGGGGGGLVFFGCCFFFFFVLLVSSAPPVFFPGLPPQRLPASTFLGWTAAL